MHVQGLSLDLDQDGGMGEVDAWGRVCKGRLGMEAAASHQLPVADSIVEVRQEKASNIHRFLFVKEFVCLFVTQTLHQGTHQGVMFIVLQKLAVLNAKTAELRKRMAEYKPKKTVKKKAAGSVAGETLDPS